MSKPTGKYHRDSSDRLCFEMLDVDAIDYPKYVSRIVERFELKPNSELVIGRDQLIGGYSDGENSIGLDWDNWSGFFVTSAHA